MEELGTRFTNRKSENGNSLPKVLVRSVSIPLTSCCIFNVLRTRQFEGSQYRKPLKRLHSFQNLSTGLKPGENEMKTFRAKPLRTLLTYVIYINAGFHYDAEFRFGASNFNTRTIDRSFYLSSHLAQNARWTYSSRQ